jgi:hypothetical protein
LAVASIQRQRAALDGVVVVTDSHAEIAFWAAEMAILVNFS